jgi:glc operon protein GlcG
MKILSTREEEYAVTTVNVAHAMDLVRRVLDEADTRSAAITVVVVDKGGHVVASARGDGVGFVATDFARRKAVTSATFAAPTSDIAESFGQDPMLASAFSGSPDVLLLPGGFPVLVDGACVGGLGIAGSHYSQDHAVGQAVL